MSIEAAEHFARLAERYGLELPPLLEGSPQYILPPDARVALHLFDEENRTLPQLKASHKELVVSTYPFLAGVALGVEPDLPRARHAGMASVSGRYAGAVWPRLRPSGYKAGRVEDFTVEAVLPGEIPEQLLTRVEAERTRLARDLLSECEIFLLTTARLHAGRPLGRVGCLTKVSMGYADNERTVVNSTPSVVVVALPVNEGLRASGEWQSRAIGRLLYGVELRRPLQGGLPTMGKDKNLGGGAQS